MAESRAETVGRVMAHSPAETQSRREAAPWPKVRPGEICDVRDGTHSSPKETSSGRLLITSKNLLGGRLSLANAYYISVVHATEIDKRSKVDRWDILFSMIGTVGEVALIKEDPNFVISVCPLNHRLS